MTFTTAHLGQALRNWGMNAVGGNPLIKSWLMRQAMG